MSAGSQRSLETCRFVVIGARRTGTNILREILNTNCEIAMLGEVFTPSSAPAHWPNFIAHRPFGELPPLNSIEASSLLDEYFEFVEYRIRNHWHNNSKALSRALGVDIKYDQLSEVKPRDRPPTASPFLLDYLKRRGFIIVHSVRKNVIKCAISEMVAQERNLWHNYNRAIIDRTYYIDPNDCLSRARKIVQQYAGFERLTNGWLLIEAIYEHLAETIAAAPHGRIAEDAIPFKDIAQALKVSLRFKYDGRLRRAINIPYSRLISNYHELRSAVADSEFCQFTASLE